MLLFGKGTMGFLYTFARPPLLIPAAVFSSDESVDFLLGILLGPGTKRPSLSDPL